MKLGAYQFSVTKNIKYNLETVKKAIIKASHEGVKLLVFPECALTGYPPRDIENSSVVNFQELNSTYGRGKKIESLGIKERETFLSIYPMESIPNLTIEQYTSGDDSFSHWLRNLTNLKSLR